MSHRLNIAPGHRFGRFVVVEEAQPNDYYRRRNMLVRCDCGTVKTVHLTRLVSGISTSCGCSLARPRRTDAPPDVDGCRWVAVYPDLWALVADHDYENVSQVLWRKHKRYAATRLKADNPRGFKTVLMHRYIFGHAVPSGCVVDHINGNGLDNRPANIRFVTPQQNKFNSKPAGKRKLKGAHRSRSGWQSEIRHNGVRHYLGRFDSEIDAARAYNEAAKRLFGEYAWLNVFDDSKDDKHDAD
jgi:hypothetical protein